MYELCSRKTLFYPTIVQTKAISKTNTSDSLFQQFSTNANNTWAHIPAKDKYQGHVIDQMNEAIQVEKLPFPVSFGLEMLIPNRYIREIPTRMINPTKSIPWRSS